MYSHIHPFSLYVAPVGHEQVTPEPQEPPPFRRSRSATERFAFFRRAVSAGPAQPPSSNMSATTSNLAANLSPSNASDLNTLPDPRSPSPNPSAPGTPKPGQHHPDLSNEVAALSAKLINAINHQTNLDDTLQETRHELDAARKRIAQLEREAKEHRDALSQGLLVRRKDSVQTEERLQNTIIEERKKRSSAERERKGMEQELENLTSQLFEEANKMVAAARQEREAADRKSDQLRNQLKDTENLLASQQDQLTELKTVLQDVQLTPTEIVTTAATAPASPSSDKVSSKTFDYPTHQRNAQSLQTLPPPESPLHFSHLIHPVVRVDHQAYEDFISLLRTNKSSGRASSGSYVGMNVLGLMSKDGNPHATFTSIEPSGPTNSSRSTSAPNPPSSSTHSPNPSTDSTSSQMSSLKDSRYYKRALVEDIEPTLRLDTAPALSWLARRTVINSISTGKLIIEPYPPRHAFHSPAYACALCGEVRTNDEHLRRFRFRTSDSDDVQRYPLCDYCLSRVRTTCDFTTFLREARKGHMRNETPYDCRVAWEECIRLRERMFWSRIGGGVVPTPYADTTPRMESPTRKRSGESERESNVTQASRSDSDVPSVHRADSGLSTGSEVCEPSPLSEVMTRDELEDADEEKPALPAKDHPKDDEQTSSEEIPTKEEHPLAQVTSAGEDTDRPSSPTHAGSAGDAAVTESTNGPELSAQNSKTSIDDPTSDLTPSASGALASTDAPSAESEAPQQSASPRAQLDASSPSPTSPHAGPAAEPPTVLTKTTSNTTRPPSLLSPLHAKRQSVDSSDPQKQPASPMRNSKVASLASKFAGLDNPANSPPLSPRSPRPTSSHSTRGALRSESASPARLSFDAARHGSTASPRLGSPERGTPLATPSPTRDAAPPTSASPGQRDSGVKIPGSFW